MNRLQEKVEASLRNVERSGEMSLDKVDFTMKNRDLVRERLGGCLQYFARVENEVDPEGLKAMMPLIGTTYLGYKSYGQDFLDLWVPQELVHGKILDAFQLELDIEPLKAKHDISQHNFTLGRLGEEHPRLHQTVELTYYSQGAVQEALAFTAYARCHEILTEMGETALAETIFKDMRDQEGIHRSFYRINAKYLREQVSWVQAQVARAIVSFTISPVGAGEDKDKPHMGYVVESLGGDEVDAFAGPAFAEAEALLGVNPRWIRRAFAKCTDAHAKRPYSPPFAKAA